MARLLRRITFDGPQRYTQSTAKSKLMSLQFWVVRQQR